MNNLVKHLEELENRLLALKSLLKIENLEKEEGRLKKEMEAVNFWQDQERAVKVSRRAEIIRKDLDSWRSLKEQLKEAKELASLSEGDDKMSLELEKNASLWEKEIDNLEQSSLYSGKYDDNNAILSINAGTGGVDAQDWAQMLERMYLRFAERQGFKADILDRIMGNEAGIKSMTMKISGLRVYGNLKSENGTHRLLRNSPFNADGLRQTSFASVEVIPEIEAKEVKIKDEDVRIDVFRSSGPGGQSVNTTDSAVRLTHIPSGLTVSCQSERSQHQNKDNAFSILRSRLAKLEEEKREKKEKELKGGVVKAEWGQQVRSYWFYGNRLVKDHRSGFEDSDVDGVMDGKLEGFISAYLHWQNEQN